MLIIKYKIVNIRLIVRNLLSNVIKKMVFKITVNIN